MPDMIQSQPCGSGDVYRALGVEPLINCAGTRTAYGGSNPLNAVRLAMDEASTCFVDLDELGEAAGRRIAGLTAAPWGIVTAGSAAALGLATAACLAGNNPELVRRLPNLPDGYRRLVLVPKGHRFPYEQAIETAGGKIISAETVPHCKEIVASGDVSMICLIAKAENSTEIKVESLLETARTNSVPILVDAAARAPSNPDRWLKAGADLVVYSGGKFLRGPQSTGFLLGREDLCRAAWVNGAPHQAYGRMMKIGKEEIVGALVALEEWLLRRDQVLQLQSWLKRLKNVQDAIAFSGVRFSVVAPDPASLSPRLRVDWSETSLRLTSEELRLRLLEGRPRIQIQDFWSGRKFVLIDPFNLGDDESHIVGRTISDALAASDVSRAVEPVPGSEPELAGLWRAELGYSSGKVEHELRIECDEHAICGEHLSEFSSGDLDGSIGVDGAFSFTSRHEYEPADLYFSFRGRQVELGSLIGTVALGSASPEHAGPVFQGQFGTAPWSARRLSGFN